MSPRMQTNTSLPEIAVEDRLARLGGLDAKSAATSSMVFVRGMHFLQGLRLGLGVAGRETAHSWLAL